MEKLINVVLLYGGKSGEHEISQLSAAEVLSHLDSSKYSIIPVGMGKDGCFYLNDYKELLTHKKSLPIKTTNSKLLASLLVNGKFVFDADVVFPMVHGPLYEDGCLQGLLQLSGIAYVGCDVISSAIGMDKDMARRVACVDGIKSARYRALSRHLSASEISLFCENVVKEFGWPLFVKPNSMGSSVGINKAKNMEELLDAVAEASRYDETILVEEAIVGREIELAVLENEELTKRPRVSTAGEILINHKDGFYSYTAKYLESDKSELLIPALLSEDLICKLQSMAQDIFLRLKCKGLARVDFFVNDETSEIFFNEINTLPGFTTISMYPKLWEFAGISYCELLDNLISRALSHQRNRAELVTNYN